MGIWTAVDKSYLEILMRNQLYMSAAWVLVAVGAMTIILSFIGCTGSLTVGNYRIQKNFIELIFCLSVPGKTLVITFLLYIRPFNVCRFAYWRRFSLRF